jgi:Zn-dependent peptidase ImmA (M78 family)
MSLPNEIVFGSRLIKLDFIDKETASKKKIFGEFDSDKNTMTIDKSLDNIEMSNTLLHEIFHLIHDEYKIDLPAKAEEISCNSLANGICHVLYQNQNLLEFLYKSLKKA